MDYTLFFEKNDQLCYTLLQKFAVNRSHVVTQEAILDSMPISDYKLGQLLATLNADLATIKSTNNASIDVIDKNVLRGTNITITAVHEIRLMYLQRSILFALFSYNLLKANRKTKTAFREAHFISKTKFYAAQLELRDILNGSDFYQSPSIIKTTEYVTRLRLFEFFYTVFNGIGSPFPEEDTKINNLIVTLQAQFNFIIKPVQRTKLETFLKIWLLRVLNNNPMDAEIIPQSNIDHLTVERLKSIKSAITEAFNVTLSDYELNYLYSFLVTQQYLPGIQRLLDREHFSLAYQLSEELIQVIINRDVLLRTDDLDTQDLLDTLICLHLRFTTFYVEPTTFISLDQIGFFQESYPIFHSLIGQFIDWLQHHTVLTLNQREAANLYFDYMFALINCVPKSLLRDKVFICVDFSQGALYSNYIVQTLNGFSNANIIIEDNLSPNTDIYLSDFYTPAVKQPQTIWRNPPTPDDWSALGDQIVNVKQAKVSSLVEALSKDGAPHEPI